MNDHWICRESYRNTNTVVLFVSALMEQNTYNHIRGQGSCPYYTDQWVDRETISSDLWNSFVTKWMVNYNPTINCVCAMWIQVSKAIFVV